MEKKVMICPKCHHFYFASGKVFDYKCDDCHVALRETSISYPYYSSLGEQEKSEFRKKYIEQHFSTVSSDPVDYTPLENSGWVSFIRFLSLLIILICVCFGVFMMASGGILIGLAIIFGGFVLVSGTMVLAVIAEDIRHIRNSVEYYTEFHQ